MTFKQQLALMQRINDYAQACSDYQRAFQKWLNDPCDEAKNKAYKEAEQKRDQARENMYDYVFEL